MGLAKLRTVLLATVLTVVVSGASVTGAAPLGTAAAPSAVPAAAQLPVPTATQSAGGNLWMYRGNGAGGWAGDRAQVGTGWNVMTAIIGAGDFSGDGFVDVLARDTGGLLWMYRGNGAGGWLAPGERIGNGWNGMTAIIGAGDFSGDGFVDILARDSAGGTASVDCAVRACVALTFDDGPSPHTNRLLDSLISLQVPATFFVVGHQVAARPTIVRRQHANGFPVENHTYSHPQLTTLSLAAQQSEVNRADDAIATAGVPRSTQLRPPYGSWNANTRQLGKPLILWSVDPRDWDGRTAAQIRSHVVANATAGSIVLMHDSVSATVDAVPGIVSDLRARGFTLVTVQTLIPNLRPGDVVYSRTNINRTGSVGTLSEGAEVLRAPDGTILGEVVDEAPFVPER